MSKPHSLGMEKNFNASNLGVLWIFGFALIKAIMALAEIGIQLFYHYGLSHDFSIMHYKYLMPVFCLVFYALFIGLGSRYFWRVNRKAKSNFPAVRVWVVLILLLFGMGAPYLSRHLSNKQLEAALNDPERVNFLMTLEFDRIDQIIEISNFSALFVCLSIAVLYLYSKSRKG